MLSAFCQQILCSLCCKASRICACEVTSCFTILRAKERLWFAFVKRKEKKNKSQFLIQPYLPPILIKFGQVLLRAFPASNWTAVIEERIFSLRAFTKSTMYNFRAIVPIYFSTRGKLRTNGDQLYMSSSLKWKKKMAHKRAAKITQNQKKKYL